MPYLPYEDGELYYELLEHNSQNPCLVFLHEGLGCSAMWKGFPRLLCEQTSLSGLLYDRQGYGNSSPLTRPRTIHYLHEYTLKELPYVLNRLIPGKEYFLVGHSDGGTMALMHAAERFPLLKGIITEAAHIFVDEETLAGIRSAEAAWEQGKLDGLKRYHGDKTETIFKAWSRTWQSDWFSHWNIEYLLPSITVPILALQGADDQYGTDHQVDIIVGGTQGSALKKIVPECGHVPHLEAQQAVLEIMADFISSNVDQR